MSYGFSESRLRSHRRRRTTTRLLKWLFFLALFGGIGLFAYETGTTLAHRETERLDRALAEQSELLRLAEAEAARLAEQLAAAERREAQLRAAYERDVPTGERAALVELVADRLEGGVRPERLKEVLGAVENRRACEDSPVTRRFYVTTPLFQGANDTVSFFDGAVVVRATGEPARNDAGAPEAWYDPAQPVVVRFTHIGGATSRAEGELPLHHAMVVNDSELVFNAVAGARGFLQVTADRCRYP